MSLWCSGMVRCRGGEMGSRSRRNSCDGSPPPIPAGRLVNLARRTVGLNFIAWMTHGWWSWLDLCVDVNAREKDMRGLRGVK